ncbi:T9SS type A sorting domain-containing protein [bacterium]|nr:T9SS type A sorting domain-containing protein [bacterium]
MKSGYFYLLLGSLLLAGSMNARADWLGLMNGENALDGDGYYNAKNMDISFDQNNNGVSIITKEGSNWIRVFVSKQTYGGDNWAPEIIPINANLLGHTIDPDLDILPSGKGFGAYAQNTSIRYRIYGNSFSGNGVFSNVVNDSNPIDTGMANNAEQPSVAMLNDNTAIIAFIQASGTNIRVFSSKWENNEWSFWAGDTGWTSVATSGQAIDGWESRKAVRPCLAKSLDTKDLFCVFAKGEVINEKNISASRYSNGQWYIWGVGGWKIMGDLSVNTESVSVKGSNLDADCPRLAPLSNGRMLCVYELKDNSSNNRIHYTIYNGHDWMPGVPSDFVDVAGNSVLASAPDLAVSPQGKVICVYARGNTKNAFKNVYAVEWDGNSWIAMNNGQKIDTVGNSVTALTPKIEFDNLGNAICVFQQFTDDKTRVYANYFQGPPFISSVSPDGAENNGRVTIAVYGNNFADQGTPETRIEAWLRKDTEPYIIGQNIKVKTQHSTYATAHEFSVEFDLNGVAVGDWDLVVENPDGQSYVAENIFGINWPDLDKAHVYPNPIRPGSSGTQSAQVLRFFNLTREAKVRIYTLKGELIRTLTKKDRQLFIEWDLRNEAGRMAAPGVYLYRIESEKGSINKGKFMIIR